MPRSSTSALQWTQWWGQQRGKPRRRPTAILPTSLSSRRPMEATGRALSHAPDSLEATASGRARVLGLREDSKRICCRASIPGASQACWRREVGGVGGGWLCPWLQMVLALTVQGLVVSCSWGGKDQVNQFGAALSGGQVGGWSQLSSASDSNSSSSHR